MSKRPYLVTLMLLPLGLAAAIHGAVGSNDGRASTRHTVVNTRYGFSFSADGLDVYSLTGDGPLSAAYGYEFKNSDGSEGMRLYVRDPEGASFSASQAESWRLPTHVQAIDAADGASIDTVVVGGSRAFAFDSHGQRHVFIEHGNVTITLVYPAEGTTFKPLISSFQLGTE